MAALVLWGLSYWFEHASDMQKQRWLKQRRRALRAGEGGAEAAARLGEFCREGHWMHCRHPNYLGEWGVWCALTLLALPALAHHLRGADPTDSADRPAPSSAELLETAGDWARKALLAGGLASVPVTMYDPSLPPPPPPSHPSLSLSTFIR